MVRIDIAMPDRDMPSSIHLQDASNVAPSVAEVRDASGYGSALPA
jgi:hypothetical protein